MTKPKLTRQEVYVVLDTERDYQDYLWDNLNKEINNPSSFILWMEEYLNKARTLASSVDERSGTVGCIQIMDVIRKVTAMGVACMEVNGAPMRITNEKS